jgi:sugar lactone lactonase YvrE
MLPIPVEVIISENQECSLPLPAAAIQSAPESQVRRDRKCRMLKAFTARRKRSWMPVVLTALLLATSGAWAQSGVFVTPQPAGAISSARSVTVTAQTAGTVATVEVLTLGASGLDFAGVSSSSTCPSAILASTQACTESVTFTPAFPGLRRGAVVLFDSNNNVLGTAYLSGTGVGGLGVLVPGNVITVAGVYRNWTSTQDGVPATQANLDQPSSLAFDGAGNLYIADSAHNRIRKVAAPIPPATAGIITTIAGTGVADYTGDGQSASAATLSSPSGVALDGAGNLYIADTGNNVIRKITAATGNISTVAGNINGIAGYAGDGGLATSAELNLPLGITVDGSGNLYIADTANQRIRKVAAPVSPAVAGIISTVAGDGVLSGTGDGKGTYSGDGGRAIDAGLSLPYAVALDLAGNMYIPDSANNVIRMVTAVSGAITANSTISTMAGFYPGTAGNSGDGGPATAAQMNEPSGVALDAAGNLYIADTQNTRIRKVNGGNIATLVVNDAGTNLNPGGTIPSAAQIYAPMGLFLDGNGNLYFADYFYMLIEEIQSNEAVLSYTQTSVQVGNQSAPQTQKVENDGNAALALTAFTPDSNAALAQGTSSCSLITPLAVDADCLIYAVFAPSLTAVFPPGVASEQLEGNIDVFGNTISYPLNTVNFPLDIVLVGDATPVNATILTLISNSPKDATGDYDSSHGQLVTFTATVTSGAGEGTPTGTVTFKDGATVLGSPVTLNSTGVATDSTAALAVGTHTITASYTPSASSNYLPSPPATLIQNVGEVTATSLTSSGSPSALGASVTLTATVSISGGGSVTPDGTVTFTDTTTGTILGSQTLGPSGIVTQSTAALTYGPHTITATYSGDAAKYILGSSAASPQDVLASSTPTLVPNPNPSIYGNTVTFTVTVPTIGSVAATGKVNFYMAGQANPLNPAPLSLATVAGTGTVVFTTSSLPVSTIAVPDIITASYLGDLNYAPLTSNTVNQVVNQAVTSTSVSALPNPAVAGKAVTITASVTVTQGASTPTGNITFTDSLNGGARFNLACTPQPTVASPTCTTTALAVGLNAIGATYAGDTDAAGSQATAFGLSVDQETITLVSNPNPSIYGMPVSFTVAIPSIGSVAATGTVNILDNGQTIGTITLPGTTIFTTSSLPVSTVAAPDVITASYAGDSNYIPIVSAPVNQVVNKATTSTAVSSLPNPGIAGGAEAITATVTVTQGVSTPTGSVTFTDGGANLGTVALNGAGTATINPMLVLGLHSIVATYSGDSNDSGSASASLPLTVNQANTTTALASSYNPSLVLAPVTFTATVASIGGGVPSGNVTFTDTFNSTTVTLSCAGSLTAGSATCTTTALASGTHTITAAYGGDTNDAHSSSTLSQVVGTVPTLTGLGSSTTAGVNPQVILVATVINYSTTTQNASSLPTPTGTVTFSTVSGSTLTQIGSSPVDSSGVATFIPASLPPGTSSIVAAYSGDLYHSPSTSVATTISNPASGFTLTVTPASVSVAASQNVTVTVTLAPISGFTDTIGLGCASLPAGVNCHFSTPTVTLPATGAQNVQLTIDTNNPLGGGSVAMNARPGGRGVSLAGLFLPLSVLFGIFFWRFRRRYALAMTTGLVLLLGVAAMLVTGCSGFSQSSATPGTYVIQVTGVGANSNITHYQDVTLTITK